MEQSNNIFAQRILALRQQMKAKQLDAYIIPSSDPHMSEYLPEKWQARQWLSGFTGSAGTLVVTQEMAGLWTDSRYWTQAEKQLANSGITLKKQETAQDAYEYFLASELAEGSCVGVDGTVLSVATKQHLVDTLSPRKMTINTEHDLLDAIWQDRPALPQEKAYPHKLTFCSQSREEKLIVIRHAMRASGANWHLLSALDDIAWLTNTRGRDASYNPVFLAHMLISQNEVFLFADPNKFSESLTQSLLHDGITIRPYETIFSVLKDIEINSCLLFDPQKVSTCLIDTLSTEVKLITEINPSFFAKSQKKEEDLLHTRQAMESDGVALCEFFAWLEEAIEQGKSITELTIDEKITAARAKNEYYVSNSFSTIAAFNANGAQPHYRATEEDHAVIKGDGLLLIDSGAQYHTGTTDITRVVPIGTVSEAQKRDFTLVLKAHISLATVCFPDGIESPLLDVIARAPLWAEQIDYGHGTGHGVGYFLNVHEGPQVISYRTPALPHTKMRAGMITSNEPGLYRPNQWGIRIENLLAAIPVETPKEQDFGKYLQFETLTLCPIDTRCIDTNYLTQKEVEWLNGYHKKVFDRLAHKLDGKALTWLTQRTQAIK